MRSMSAQEKSRRKKAVDSAAGRTEPEHSLTSDRRTRNVTYFRCVHCKFEFSLPDSAYENEPYSSACLQCNRPITIQTVQSQSSMDVIELFGVEYGRRGLDVTVSLEPTTAAPASPEKIMEWIQDHAAAPSATIRPDSFSKEETFLDDFASKWVVRVQDGRKYEFEFFAALRKAIEEGRIGPKDKITASDGKSYKVSQYPGTADLFGNSALKNRVRAGLGSARNRKTPRWRRTFDLVYRASLVLVVAASLASIGYWGPKHLTRWRQFKGERFVHSLTSDVTIAAGDTFDSALAEAGRLFRSADPDSLANASSYFVKALSLNSRSAEAVTGFAENLSELAALTADRSDLGKAENLVDYAEVLAPTNPATARARAHLLWRTGKTQDAIGLMMKQPETFRKEPRNAFLLARMGIDAGDYVLATLHLSEALNAEPANVLYLKTFADVSERQGKYAQAAALLEKAQAASENPGAFTEHLADLYLKSKEIDAAVAVYRRAIRRGETTEINYAGLVQALAGANRPQDTISASLQYLTNFPAGPHAPEIRDTYQKSLSAVDPSGTSGSDRPTGRYYRRRTPVSRR
jgi:tetratricopeptide (TPR) repeat protein